MMPSHGVYKKFPNSVQGDHWELRAEERIYSPGEENEESRKGRVFCAERITYPKAAGNDEGAERGPVGRGSRK